MPRFALQFGALFLSKRRMLICWWHVAREERIYSNKEERGTRTGTVNFITEMMSVGLRCQTKEELIPAEKYE